MGVNTVITDRCSGTRIRKYVAPFPLKGPVYLSQPWKKGLVGGSVQHGFRSDKKNLHIKVFTIHVCATLF